MTCHSVRIDRVSVVSRLILEKIFELFFVGTNETARYIRVSVERGSTVPTGLSLRGGGRGFPPATKNVAPGYFHRKIEEK